MPPRGAVGEPRHILSPNTNMVRNRTREMPAASKPLGRPRDQAEIIEYDTSTRKHNKRGNRSNEPIFRRIEYRRSRGLDSRRIYRTSREMTPKEEWGSARPSLQGGRASKAGGTDSKMTRKRPSWKKHWYSQNESIKYDGGTRGDAPKRRYSKQLKVASLNIRNMRGISEREQ